MSDGNAKMKLHFERKANAPDSLIANVTIDNCPIPGIEMREIGVWAGKDGKDDFVTFNGRTYTDQSGKKKSVRFLGPMGGDWTAHNRFCNAIIEQARAWYESSAGGEGGGDPDDAGDNPFA